MKAFYKKLLETFNKEEIKDLYRTKELTPVQFIDIYAEQDLIPEWFEAHQYPALLVSWNIHYTESEAVAHLTFSICYEQLHDTSSLGQNTDLALKFLDFVEITDKVLKSIETPNTGKLYLQSEQNKIDETVTDVYLLNYQCNYTGKKQTLQKEYLQGDYEDISVKTGLYSQLLD